MIMRIVGENKNFFSKKKEITMPAEYWSVQRTGFTSCYWYFIELLLRSLDQIYNYFWLLCSKNFRSLATHSNRSVAYDGSKKGIYAHEPLRDQHFYPQKEIDLEKTWNMSKERRKQENCARWDRNSYRHGVHSFMAAFADETSRRETNSPLDAKKE